MNYRGTVIEESLKDKGVLSRAKIISTKVEQVNDSHKTPWLNQWTLHDVEIPEERADEIAEDLSKSLESEHPWYADFKNEKFHFIVYRGRVFKVDLDNPVLYENAKAYGISLGIPPYQVDFALKDEVWKR